MYNYLKHFDIPTLVICTKEDKIAKGKVQKHIKRIKDKLELESGDIISYSSIKIVNSKKFGTLLKHIYKFFQCI